MVRFVVPRTALLAAAAGLVAALFAPTGFTREAGAELARGTVSGLQIPRFVSLRSDRVNVRGGPSRDHDITWTFMRAGLPVEIVAEFDNWRRIRDWEGAEGWVYHSLLSGRRTGLVSPRSRETALPLRDRPDARGTVVARLQPGVLGTIRTCSGAWCRLSGQGFDGWIEQELLWGAYPNERVE